jgi:hypothetical protein
MDCAANQGGKMMQIIDNVRKGKSLVMMRTKEAEREAIND